MQRANCRATLASLVIGVVATVGAGAVAAQSSERPDFTGVWGTAMGGGGGGGGFGGRGGGGPRLKPEAQAKVDEYNALTRARGITPGMYCLGSGMPASMLGSGAYPMEIVQRDDIILVVYEAHAEIRRIYLKDRAADEDLFADRNGYSFGWWEGDKLVVETTHLKEAVDQGRYPHSDQAKIVEEYTMTVGENGAKTLTARMTMTDPVFYDEPVVAEKRWSFQPGARLLPYECNEPAFEAVIDELREQAAAQSGG